MSSFYVKNFGCRATQADGAALERQLLETGLQRAFQPEAADVVVLNTCTVTAAADRDARAAIRHLHRSNPACRILVTGCYAQRAPHEIAALAGVTWVVGNSHKHEAASIAAAGAAPRLPSAFVPLAALAHDKDRRLGAGIQSSTAEIVIGDIFAHTELLAAPVFERDLDGGLASDIASDKTRPNLKVQDGFNNRCSFCVIPYVRGRSRSLPLGEVLREVEALIAAGYRELVLSGINLGRWGRDFGTLAGTRLRFADLVRAILDRTTVEKLRISSVEPMDWSDELIALAAASPRIAKHAHVPLQSGSDTVLRRMHRKYRPWHYADRLRRIRAAMPDAAIGADVMAGFPGESDAEFEQTRSFIAELPFTYLHVFTFSARPGTPAAVMPRQVPVSVARERNRVLRELAAEKNLAFRRSFVCRELSAITLARADDNATEALTDNYLKLQIAGKHRANRWVRARITDVTEDGLSGRVAT